MNNERRLDAIENALEPPGGEEPKGMLVVEETEDGLFIMEDGKVITQAELDELSRKNLVIILRDEDLQDGDE